MVRAYALYLAWLIALSGLLVSLYFGEVLHMEPCRLCWYQRIALFPLVLFLGIAAYKDDRQLGLYCLPLVLIGALFAFYQEITTHFPAFHSHLLCEHPDYCTIPIFSLFGFLSFPLLSALGFVAIGVLLVVGKK